MKRRIKRTPLMHISADIREASNGWIVHSYRGNLLAFYWEDVLAELEQIFGKEPASEAAKPED